MSGTHQMQLLLGLAFSLLSYFIIKFLLFMSNTLATVSVSPQNNPMRKGIKVGVIILSALMKRPRLRELVIGQGQ